MSSDKPCTRDDCKPANVKPELTTKCSNCEAIVHLPCIGIESLTVSQLSLPNIKILCNKCVKNDTTNTTVSVNMESSFTKATPKNEKLTIKAIMNEVIMLRNVVETNSKKLDTIDKKTDTICTNTLVDMSTIPKQQQTINTPKTSKQTNVHTPQTSFANIIRNNLPPKSAKRRRTENSPKTVKYNAPKPKTGTKTAFSGLSVVAKPKRIEKPTFAKAVWVSRLNPETTNEEIIDYIEKNTPVNDKFNVHKLVKKDRDVSTLKFVSFKVEVNEHDFEILMNPDVWPEDVMVREFLKNPTLGDFFPDLNAQKNRKLSTETIDLMDLSPTQTPKQQTTQNKLSAKISPTKQ